MLGRRRSCLPGRILGLLLAQWQGTKAVECLPEDAVG
jgi:hypothetical protein